MILSVVKRKGSKVKFRRQFRRSLKQCVKKGISVEECFGVIWVEMVEETDLSESEYPKLYAEMIAWARKLAAKD